jgi:hypothetical protein
LPPVSHVYPQFESTKKNVHPDLDDSSGTLKSALQRPNLKRADPDADYEPSRKKARVKSDWTAVNTVIKRLD